MNINTGNETLDLFLGLLQMFVAVIGMFVGILILHSCLFDTWKQNFSKAGLKQMFSKKEIITCLGILIGFVVIGTVVSKVLGKKDKDKD